jgi:dTDP-4-dehydrorhamnose reductase
MTNVDACELDHAACDAQNVDAVKYIVEACNEVKSHLVQISTDFIFDGKNGPYTEDAAPAPLSYYGNSKLKGEELVINGSQSWAIVRTVLVFGIVANMSRSNIVLWAKGALEKGAPIHVVDDQFRTPTLAEDLATGCMLIEQKHAQGIYNISGKDFMSIYELVGRVARFFKLNAGLVNRANSQTFTQPAARPLVTGFVLDKAIRELGYAPHSFEEGMALIQQQLLRAAV